MTRKQRRIRRLVALAASGVIAALIFFEAATPYPALMTAYLICIGFGMWGFIDIMSSLGAVKAGRV